MLRQVETDPATERALAWLAALNGMTVEDFIAWHLAGVVRDLAERDPRMRAVVAGGRGN